ncbi:MAG TPA: hypothetical protein PLU35_09930 [Phycisphaerales bacterium]|nr:hypothetical protein [Phycisphaerales bacterium]
MTPPHTDRRIGARPIALCVLAAACTSGGGCVSPSGDWVYRKTGIDLSPEAFEQTAEDIGHALEVVVVVALWFAHGIAACNSGFGWSVSDGYLRIRETPAHSWNLSHILRIQLHHRDTEITEAEKHALSLCALCVSVVNHGFGDRFYSSSYVVGSWRSDMTHWRSWRSDPE